MENRLMMPAPRYWILIGTNNRLRWLHLRLRQPMEVGSPVRGSDGIN